MSLVTAATVNVDVHRRLTAQPDGMTFIELSARRRLDDHVRGTNYFVHVDTSWPSDALAASAKRGSLTSVRACTGPRT
jgi:hypothetical protein